MRSVFSILHYPEFPAPTGALIRTTRADGTYLYTRSSQHARFTKDFSTSIFAPRGGVADRAFLLGCKAYDRPECDDFAPVPSLCTDEGDVLRTEVLSVRTSAVLLAQPKSAVLMARLFTPLSMVDDDDGEAEEGSLSALLEEFLPSKRRREAEEEEAVPSVKRSRQPLPILTQNWVFYKTQSTVPPRSCSPLSAALRAEFGYLADDASVDCSVAGCECCEIGCLCHHCNDGDALSELWTYEPELAPVSRGMVAWRSHGPRPLLCLTDKE